MDVDSTANRGMYFPTLPLLSTDPPPEAPSRSQWRICELGQRSAYGILSYFANKERWLFFVTPTLLLMCIHVPPTASRKQRSKWKTRRQQLMSISTCTRSEPDSPMVSTCAGYTTKRESSLILLGLRNNVSTPLGRLSLTDWSALKHIGLNKNSRELAIYDCFSLRQPSSACASTLPQQHPGDSGEKGKQDASGSCEFPPARQSNGQHMRMIRWYWISLGLRKQRVQLLGWTSSTVLTALKYIGLKK